MEASKGFIQKLRDLFGLDIKENTDLEEYCKKHYQKINNFAYDSKRLYKNESYPVFLNEMITPNAFMIKKDLLRRVVLSDDRFQRVRNVGNIVAQRITWTSDKDTSNSSDYYLYPAEVLTSDKGDCEDHAFVMTSALPLDLGVAYGFWNGGGHAFNVTILHGELYVVDTVTDSVVIQPYKDNMEYKIHYIITPTQSFALDRSVQFGTIAGWDD
jgi:predicted transglutaminase-like cysteine proteinase